MEFLSPARLWFLLLIPVVIAAYVFLQHRRSQYALRFTNIALLDRVAPRRPQWRRHLAVVLALFATASCIIAFAQPKDEVKVPRERATIVVAIDVSLSMMATDVDPNRLEAAKKSAKNFVEQLPAKFNVSVVNFAGTASIIVPPTTDRATVQRSIDGLELAESTATGEGIFTSLTAIQNYQSSLEEGGMELPPARIVLLSDGYSTVGRDATQAVDAANGAEVPVSTIAFGTDYGTLDLDGETVPVPVDRATLEEIADETGGSYSEAASAAELEQVYEALGSQIGYTTEAQDISPWFVRTGLLFAFLGVVASLLWTNRLL